jgi:hypothetical protein
MTEPLYVAASDRPVPAAGKPSAHPVAAAAYPRFVCRVAGLPVRVLEEQRAAETAAGLDRAAELAAELDAAREALTDGLFAAIGGLEDRELRGHLLKLRRDVHNRRPIGAERLAAARPALDEGLHCGLERYRRRDEGRRRLLEELAATYEAEVAESRRQLQAAIDDPDFRDGLLLSSRDLSAGLERYRRARTDRLGAKERQLERGLLRYLSRMAIKTTPFGTFTALVPGRLAASGGDGLRFDGDPRRKRPVVRLNKRIYAVLREELLADEATRAHLPVELNPTLHVDGDQWRFLAGLGDREVFQRVPRGPVLELFRDALAGGVLPRRELERRVAARPEIEASAEEVAAYTERLLEIGFLRFNLGIGEQEADWDRPLARLLEPVGSETAERVRRLVDRLRAGCDGYRHASLDRRRRLLDETTAEMVAFSERLGDKDKTFRADVPFYVDAAGDASLPVPGDELATAFDELATWIRLTARIAWPREEQAEMRAFFDRFYGDASVPLLRFYEDYYREHFKEHLERLRHRPHARPAEGGDEVGDDGEEGTEAVVGAGAEPETEPENVETADEPARFNPFGLELLDAMKASRERIRELVDERWRSAPEAEEMALSPADLEAAVAELPDPAAPCHSASTFAQLLPGVGHDGGTALLVGHTLGGFGKYFSRFLHVLPEELRDDLVAHNDALTSDLLAEISADGAFNANLHPPLLHWEVSYPTGDRAGLQQPILVSDLRVEAYPGDPHALCLRHEPTGGRVVPLDLGFQNPQLRPPLFQLLIRFAPAVSYGLDLWHQPKAAEGEEAEAADAEPRISHRPRLRFGERLVLARRRWNVPAELFPRREAAESDFEYVARADAWRREHGLPREVFLSIYPQPVPRPPSPAPEKPTETEPGEARTAEPPTAPPRRRGHLNKPQYIDFANPLLVDLLGRSVEGLDGFVAAFYERLPAAEHLVAAGEDRYATELVTQIDLRRMPAAAMQEESPGEMEEAGVGG